MALESTDLFVVQKQGGAKEIRKASLTQLSDYLQAEPGVVYKGLANFTDSAEEPASKNIGDLYINNAPGDGTWAWSANSDGITDVKPGDRALYNGTTWDVIQSGTDDAGVTKVTGSLPISITGTAEEPNVEVRQATTTQDGVVARLATAADVGKDGTGSTSAVVTADLLKQVNVDIDGLDTGVTGVTADEPLSVTGDAASPNLVSREASTTESGHVARLATNADVTANTGTGASDAVVTADLLKKSNEDILSATSGGVTSIQGVDPIEVDTDGTNGSTTNSPAVSIKDSAIGQRGAIAILDEGTVFGDPADSIDYATWVGTLDATEAMTARVTSKNFVYAYFSALEEA